MPGVVKEHIGTNTRSLTPSSDSTRLARREYLHEHSARLDSGMPMLARVQTSTWDFLGLLHASIGEMMYHAGG